MFISCSPCLSHLNAALFLLHCTFLCSCVFFETCPPVSLACISVRAKTWSLLLYEAASTHHRPCWCCTAGRQEWLLLLAVPPRGPGALLWALPQGVPRQVPQTTSRARGRLVLSRVWGISLKTYVFVSVCTNYYETQACLVDRKGCQTMCHEQLWPQKGKQIKLLAGHMTHGMTSLQAWLKAHTVTEVLEERSLNLLIYFQYINLNYRFCLPWQISLYVETQSERR